jgi:membrane-bound acyltransferase YfiQ involved in biofilm formation
MEEGYSTLSFYSYLSPNVLLMTMATFILFMIGKDAFKKNSKKVIALSNAAFGIYLVHPIVLQTLSYLIFMRIKITVWIGIPLQVILAFIISFGIIWIIQRFKYSSYIVGI